MEKYIMKVPVRRIRMLNKKLSKMNDNEQISFDFILMFLFPQAFDNIKREMIEQYSKGYFQGKKDALNGEVQ